MFHKNKTQETTENGTSNLTLKLSGSSLEPPRPAMCVEGDWRELAEFVGWWGEVSGAIDGPGWGRRSNSQCQGGAVTAKDAGPEDAEDEEGDEEGAEGRGTTLERPHCGPRTPSATVSPVTLPPSGSPTRIRAAFNTPHTRNYKKPSCRPSRDLLLVDSANFVRVFINRVFLFQGDNFRARKSVCYKKTQWRRGPSVFDHKRAVL
ncbi:hypothetical protein AAG570_008313 [Ranatra chinensis]|uniref:Uncharacterized protein n=1 Tax=Ranatra chinensis TaxID=642074 RepID=A0ABD0XST1_9HEMI